MLKIFVDKLREEPGAFELSVLPREIELEDPFYAFEGRVTGQFELKVIGHDDVEGKGELETDVTTPCVRCLEPAHIHLTVPFHEVWFKREPGIESESVPFGQEEPADFTYSGDALYPAEAFRELILAELPELPLCRPDCKGLCPGCGANLNREACTCAKDEKPPVNETPAPAEEPDWKRKLRNLKNGA